MKERAYVHPPRHIWWLSPIQLHKLVGCAISFLHTILLLSTWYIELYIPLSVIQVSSILFFSKFLDSMIYKHRRVCECKAVIEPSYHALTLMTLVKFPHYIFFYVCVGKKTQYMCLACCAIVRTKFLTSQIHVFDIADGAVPLEIHEGTILDWDSGGQLSGGERERERVGCGS